MEKYPYDVIIFNQSFLIHFSEVNMSNLIQMRWKIC